MNRQFFLGLYATALSSMTTASVEGHTAYDPRAICADIEKRSGGRLGVFALDLQNRKTLAYRADERFPMCSTFKVPLVAAVLRRVDRKQEDLERRIFFTASDLEAYAPVARARLAQGYLRVGELCGAAITLSDNTAANLLLRSIGGPPGLSDFFRSPAFEDPFSRLDRTEPSLNTAIPGDERDTTTPRHMVNDLRILLTTNVLLSRASSHLLERWMRECKTGNSLLRAGVPKEWIIGDKSGTGENGTRNDIAIFRPPHRAPIIVAVYLTGASKMSDDERSACLKHIAQTLGGYYIRAI
jgi:beta-lactamase class A